jgi:hypothetical protein
MRYSSAAQAHVLNGVDLGTRLALPARSGKARIVAVPLGDDTPRRRRGAARVGESR